MKILYLLIVLTQNGAGDINASFVNTPTLAQCQQKASMVQGIFTASAIPVIESRCLQSEQHFSEFGHASSSAKIHYFYLVSFEGDAVQIENITDWPECITRAKQAAGQGKVYCSSSVQSQQ